MITFVCVYNGWRYSAGDVLRLKRAIAEHCPVKHDFVCITHHIEEMRGHGVAIAPLIQDEYEGWWAKMKVFEYASWSRSRVIYFDLDMMICGDLRPLAEWGGDFAVCANFTLAAGHKDWPCYYGSCCMSLPPGYGKHIFSAYYAKRDVWERRAGKYGDQWVIQQIEPGAYLLQNYMPDGFFASYRDLVKMPEKPASLAVGVYAGGRTPDTFGPEWAKEFWR